MNLDDNEIRAIENKLDPKNTDLTIDDVYVVKYKGKGWFGRETNRIAIIPKSRNLHGIEDKSFRLYGKKVNKNKETSSQSKSDEIEKAKADSIHIRQLDDETL